MGQPINSETIKILFENNPDTPISSAALSKSVDFVASYLRNNFEDIPASGGTLLKCDTIGDKTTSVDPKLRILMKRGSIFSIINEAENSAGDQIIPAISKYRTFDIGLEDLYITLADRDQNPVNTNMKRWGSNKEYYIFICDKDDASSYSKFDSDDYNGGAEILVSLKRKDDNGNILLYPYAIVPGRSTSGSYYSEKDTRIIGGFRSDSDGYIIEDSVWDISGKLREIKATKYSIIDEYAIDYDDQDENQNLIGRSIYRLLRPGDLDTESNSWNNVFENTITLNGNLIIGGVDPRPGTNLGAFLNSKSDKIEARLNNGAMLQTPQIFINATSTEHPRDTDFRTVTISNGMTYQGNIQHKLGDVVFNDGVDTIDRNHTFTIRSLNDEYCFTSTPNDTIGLGIKSPTARLDILDNGPTWVKTFDSSNYKKAIRLRDKSALMFGPGTDTISTSDGKKYYGISSSENKLYFYDAQVSLNDNDSAHYYMTINERNIGIGTRTPEARIHEVTNELDGSLIDDQLLLEDTRINKGSNIVLKDASNVWEIGTQSAISSSDKEGFFIYNRNYIGDSIKKRNYIFITPQGKIGSGTQDPDEDFQIEKSKDTDTFIKLLNTSTGVSSRTGISFFNKDDVISKFEVGLAGDQYSTTYSTWRDSAFIHTGYGITGGLKVQLEDGDLKVSVSGKEVGDLIVSSQESLGSFVGININSRTSDSTKQDSDGEPKYLLDVRSVEPGDIIAAQLKSDLKGSSSVGLRIQGSRTDLTWPTKISYIDFDNFKENNRYSLASIHAGGGSTSTSGTNGGLVFSVNNGTIVSNAMYLTDKSRLGIQTSLPDYELDVNGEIGLNEYLHHNDDIDTYIRFKPDEYQVKAGNKQVVWFKNNTTDPSVISIGNTEYTLVKDASLDIDINSMMYLDASEHKVLIGNEMPSSVLPIGELDIAFNKDVVQYIRTTTTDKNASLHLRGARTAITNEISSIVFENSSIESAKIATKLEVASSAKSNLIISTNNGTTDTEAVRINADQDVLIGFSSGEAKLSVNGGVHVGGTTDPGDNNLTVDSLTKTNTLYVTSTSVFDDNLTINDVTGTGDTITINVPSASKLSSFRYYGTTSSFDSAIYYFDKAYSTNSTNIAGQFKFDNTKGYTFNASDVDSTFKVYLGNASIPEFIATSTGISVNESAVFNVSKSTNGNFTIKSSTSDNIFYVGATTNQVAINGSTFATGYQLSVYNNLYVEANELVKGTIASGGKDPTVANAAGYNGWIEGSLKVTKALNVDRNTVLNASSGAYSLVINGNGLANAIYVSDVNQVARVGIGTSTLTAGSLLTVDGNVDIDGNITKHNYSTVGNSTINGYNIDGVYIQTSTATPTNDINVSRTLRWKKNGAGSVIFDASASTTPSSTACSNKDPDVRWSASYPTIMGWNGVNTYGVRVDNAARADWAATVDLTTCATRATYCQNVVGNNDMYRYSGGSTASDAGYAEIATADNGNEPIYVRQYSDSFVTVSRSATLLDEIGNTTFPGKVTATSFKGTLLNIATGTANFTGNSGYTAVAHGLGKIPAFCTVTPTANPGGYLGEVWCTWDSSYIYVYNSGSGTTAFSWMAYIA